MDSHLNPLHIHVCYACDSEIICGCSDRRQYDRETGKERQIYCFGCAELNKSLAMAELRERVMLERVN